MLMASCTPSTDVSRNKEVIEANSSKHETPFKLPKQERDQYASEREMHDATSWAKEVQAQHYERPFAKLWDDFRAADDKWQVLFDAVAPTIQLGGVQSAADLELGIRRIRFGDPNSELTADQFREKMSRFRQQGFQLVESEWHHSQFQPDNAQGPRSRFNFVLHVRRPPTNSLSDSQPGIKELRAIVRGTLVVDWLADQGAAELPKSNAMQLRDVEILTRSGPPVFERVLTYSRHPTDVASAHPILVQDLDGNGFDDIIISRWNRVYLNRGEGLFVEKRFLGRFEPHWETGAIADLDLDGAPDFFTVGKHGKPLLFRGDSQGQFSGPGEIVADVHFDAPLAVTVGDIDRDGDLDVWQTQYRLSYTDGHMPTPYYDAIDGFPSALLRNDGRGHFTDATQAAGLTTKRQRRTYSTSFVELDDDGDLDLVVVSDFAGLDVYKNDGRGHFNDVTSDIVDEAHLFGMAHTFGDYNLDGALDFYAIGMSSTTARRLDRLKLGRDDRPVIHQMRAAMAFGNRMFLSPTQPATDGRFRTPTFAASVARTGWSWGTTSFDFDNDRDSDIYVANGFRSGQSSQDYCTRFWCHDIYTGSSTPDPMVKSILAESLRELDAGKISWNGYEHNALLMNLGGRDFANVGFLMGVGCEFDSRAVVSSDLDADGRVDLLVTQYEYDGQGFVMDLHVYRNNLSNDNHWIGVRLGRNTSRLPTVGTQIRMMVNGQTQIAHVVTGDSWGAQHSNQVHFGLGDITTVEAIEVLWPGGQVQRLNRPAIGQYHQVTPRGG